MTRHRNIEDALDELGGAIGAEGSIVGPVIDRIDRLPHRPCGRAGGAGRWLTRAALVVLGGVAGIAVGWCLPRESVAAKGPTVLAGDPSARTDAPAVPQSKAAVGKASLEPIHPPASDQAVAGKDTPSATVRRPGPAVSVGAPAAPTVHLWMAKGRPWGPEQVTGFPDSPNPFDARTAWASLTADGQEEWLELTYAEAVRPMCVLVFANFKPGAVHKVAAFDPGGKEVQVWTGKDPTPAACPSGVSAIRFTTKFKVSRVRVYLDSAGVAGWNEIDAVGLIDESGRLQWATRAKASTTYEGGASPPVPAGPQQQELLRRVERLEKTVRTLQKELAELKKR